MAHEMIGSILKNNKAATLFVLISIILSLVMFSSLVSAENIISNPVITYNTPCNVNISFNGYYTNTYEDNITFLNVTEVKTYYFCYQGASMYTQNNDSFYINDIAVTNGPLQVMCYNTEEERLNDISNNVYNFSIDYSNVSTIAGIQCINNDPGANYKLLNDIDLSGIPDIQIASFSGTLDGQGYNLIGFISSLGGLFAETTGTIKNLNMVNVNVSVFQWAAGLVSIAKSGTVIDNVSVTGTINGNTHIGGIVGQSKPGSKVINSNANVIITGAYRAGGITGYNEGVINNSYSEGNIDASMNYIGGVAGLNYGEVEKSHSKSKVKGKSSVGGVVGGNWGKIKKAYFDERTANISVCVGTEAGTSDCMILRDNLTSSIVDDCADTDNSTCSTYKVLGDEGLVEYSFVVENTSGVALENLVGVFDTVLTGNNFTLEFSFNYTNSSEFSDLIIYQGTTTSHKGFVLIYGLNESKLQGTKTIYVDRVNSSLNNVCIKDTEVTSVDAITSTCTGTDEYNIPCNGNDKNGYTCTYNSTSNQYKVTGLHHSGILQAETVADPVTTTSSGGGSSSRTTTPVNSSNLTVVTNETETPEPMLISYNEETDPAALADDTQIQQDEEGNLLTTGIMIIVGAIGIVGCYLLFSWMANLKKAKVSIRKSPSFKLKTKYR